jgi:hypothetical protein
VTAGTCSQFLSSPEIALVERLRRAVDCGLTIGSIADKADDVIDQIQGTKD